MNEAQSAQSRLAPVHTLGISLFDLARILRRNQNQTQQESLQVLTSIASLANKAGLNVVAYISMALAIPTMIHGASMKLSMHAGLLIELGIRQISLADTVGLGKSFANRGDSWRCSCCTGLGAEIGVHLHARPQDAALKIRAAYRAGCRRFDAAIGGLGGCPFAQDALVGNIATETLIAELKDLGARFKSYSPWMIGIRQRSNCNETLERRPCDRRSMVNEWLEGQA
jgi:hydroxymethylglutaryl-CoA lyase